MLNVTFAVVVPGMGFTGENKLQRTILVASQFHDVIELLKNERRSLIGGKPSRKANGQGIGVE